MIFVGDNTNKGEGNYLNLNRMKKILFFLLFISVTTLSKAQNSLSDTQAIHMLREFYTTYMGDFVNATPSSDVEAQLDLLKKKYCTKNLLNKIPKLTEDSDADPLIKAQDSNEDCVKNLSFKKNLKKPNSYVVSYYYIDDSTKEKEITTINVTVVKQNGIFKIDNVQ